MKTNPILIVTCCSSLLFFTSCNKNTCAACHYDKAGAEIELGEKCGDEMATLEANGYMDSTGTYIVHCGH